MSSKEWCELASNVGVGEEEDFIKRDQYVQESRSERECGLKRERREFRVSSDGEEMPRERLERPWRAWKMVRRATEGL